MINENTLNYTYAELLGIGFNKIIKDAKERAVKVKEEVKDCLKSLKEKTSNFFSLAARKEKINTQIEEMKTEMKVAEKEGRLFELFSDIEFTKKYKWLHTKSKIAMATSKLLDLVKSAKNEKEELKENWSQAEEFKKWKENNSNDSNNQVDPEEDNKEEKTATVSEETTPENSIDPEKESTDKEIELEVQKDFEKNPIDLEVKTEKKEKTEKTEVSNNDIRRSIVAIVDENDKLKNDNKKLKNSLIQEKETNQQKDNIIEELNSNLKNKEDIISTLEEQITAKSDIINELREFKTSMEKQVKEFELKILDMQKNHEVEIKKAINKGYHKAYEEIKVLIPSDKTETELTR